MCSERHSPLILKMLSVCFCIHFYVTSFRNTYLGVFDLRRINTSDTTCVRDGDPHQGVQEDAGDEGHVPTTGASLFLGKLS